VQKAGLQNSVKDSILVIAGPTASGKTEAALSLARENPDIEIVNADASLLYRGFDIGTAKPDKSILAKVKHHLIDILDPQEAFSAADYSRLAREVIRDVIARGKTPIIVGGTGFYIDALFYGIIPIDASDEQIQEAKLRAEKEIADLGFDVMHEKLREVDPILYSQIQRERNPIRLQRAWEHYYATGEALGESRKREADAFELEPSFRVLNLPRPELWRRIEIRVDEMISAGWLGEAKRLKDAGIQREWPAMKAIGYREMFEVLDNKMTLGEARERIVIRTRQYAKRQVTWMKRYEKAIES
jgi:tRNA dimethylallyltransferase